MATLTLTDGRALDFTDAGGDAPVLLFHHGTPGSVTPLRHMQRAAEQTGLRLVTYSRAGYGASTRHAGRTVADIAPDASQLLDRLEVDRCVTAGWSGGGPHALACAALLADRVAGVASIAGAAPWDAAGLDFLAGMGEQNVEEFGAAVDGEPALRTLLEAQAPDLVGAGPAGLVEGMATLLPEVDRAELTDEFGEDMAANISEALRTGVDGWLDDDLAFVAPWGFDVAEVSVPSFVWQGDLDLMVPFAHGEWLAAHLAGTQSQLLTGEGHLSIGVGAIARILGPLAETL